MAHTIKKRVQKGSVEAPAQFYIRITADGPYLVYGHPSIHQDVIMPDDEGNSWTYRRGKSFDASGEPVALCRCGGSRDKPYCDGAHRKHRWDARETAPDEVLLASADVEEGETLILTDNRRYCAFARFCDAKGQIWNLVRDATLDDERSLVEREAAHCPGSRLIAWDKTTGEPYEPPFDPSIGLIEDPELRISGPIWVKGGIRIESADGSDYEIRNRVTLCRCGASENKPFCDGTHAAMKFHDGIEVALTEESW